MAEDQKKKNSGHLKVVPESMSPKRENFQSDEEYEEALAWAKHRLRGTYYRKQ